GLLNANSAIKRNSIPKIRPPQLTDFRSFIFSPPLFSLRSIMTHVCLIQQRKTIDLKKEIDRRFYSSKPISFLTTSAI
ncbi:MAG: hypothetical protein L0K45_02180, partial [Tetragenococcus halophilus]|nr:hypothetical protein [Tetragenococcus halophilus]